MQPSFIRVEADEVTYNLHIILRFEIERALIEDDLPVEELPRIWNSKMKELLTVDVPDDSLGVLQDVHWSGGMIGYFPTYSLGNLYSAQFFAAAKRDIPTLEEEMARGEFGKAASLAPRKDSRPREILFRAGACEKRHRREAEQQIFR